jgi:cyclic pyranopterin phosphate synthase
MSKEFSHLDKEGHPSMVDISGKVDSERVAIARSIVHLPEIVLKEFEGEDIQTKKGPVFQTAMLAGIMGAKKTSELIPLCHNIPINKCEVNIKLNDKREVEIQCTVKTNHKTGVEMEALAGASIAALTIYDMCKAFSQEIIISETCLLEKSGGKNDYKKA